MRFGEAMTMEQPALEVFNAAIATVFDDGDPCTEHLDRLTPQARRVYLLYSLDGEIHNGGFDQLFFNSLGDHCAEMLGYLEEVGAMRSHAMLKAAMAWFPGGVPSRDRWNRQDQQAAFCEDPKYQADIERLSSQYYEYEDGLASLLDAYVGRNADALVRRDS